MSKQIFDVNSSIVVTKIIPIEFCQFFTHTLLRQSDIKNQGDSQVVSAKAILDHELMFETLQERLWPQIENIIGEELLPTYAYSRLYSNGDELKPHIDRSACEISATIQLGRSHHYAWPIYMGGQRFDLGEGDAVIYKGCEVEHWREKCQGPEDYYSGQLFIHFVKKNGEHSKEANDINISSNRSNISYIKNRTYAMEIK
jgi:hypothetical protein